MNDAKLDICFLCGLPGANTRDHVPPYNLFLSKNRIDLIKVPAHLKCNKKSEKDDEYFRFCLLVPASQIDNDAKELWDKKIKGKIHRRESRGFRKYLLSKMVPVELKSKAGLVIGKANIEELEHKRIQVVIHKMARGLYHHKTQTILPLDWPIDFDWIIIEEKQAFEAAHRFISIANGIFKYCWEPSEADNKHGVFWVIFFGCVYFEIRTGDFI